VGLEEVDELKLEAVICRKLMREGEKALFLGMYGSGFMKKVVLDSLRLGIQSAKQEVGP